MHRPNVCSSCGCQGHNRRTCPNPGVAPEVAWRSLVLSSVVINEARCWIWQGGKLPQGYGLTSAYTGGKKRSMLAHQLAYRAWIGEIPAEMVINHTCRERACCNPAHLEAVTRVDNQLHGVGGSVTVCKNGHERAVVGVRVFPSGARHCAACYPSQGGQRKCARCSRFGHMAKTCVYPGVPTAPNTYVAPKKFKRIRIDAANAETERARLYAKVVVDEATGCHLWQGLTLPDGYGLIAVLVDGKRSTKSVHRFAYELVHGPIVERAMQVDHLCHTRNCVNVAHLELVTRSQNQSRRRPKAGE